MGMIIGLFISCGKDNGNNNTEPTTPVPEEGVIINGLRWATRNVGSSGRFINKPENAGTFYQWNSKKAWSSSNTSEITGWHDADLSGDTWEKANDPSPAGWRIPTLDEIKTLLDPDKVSSEWTTENNINGRKFTDKATGNSIFLPASGFREYGMGELRNKDLQGRYWSSTQSSDDSAWFLDFSSSSAEWSSFYNRRNGFSIRCVAEE